MKHVITTVLDIIRNTNVFEMSDKALTAYAKRLRAIQTVMRAYEALSEHIYRTRLKTGMLSCPLWRGRVMKDLGGETALSLWERRYERSLKNERIKIENSLSQGYVVPDDPYALPRQAGFTGFGGRSTDPGILYDRVRVDMEGEFCLAPIKNARLRAPRPKVIPYVNPFGLKVHYTDINPIPVTPDELRGKTVPDIAEETHDHAKAMAALKDTAAKATKIAEQMGREFRVQNTHLICANGKEESTVAVEESDETSPSLAPSSPLYATNCSYIE